MNKDVQGGVQLKEKQCKGCKAMKPISEFTVDRKSVDGYFGKCKACVKIGVQRRLNRLRESQQWVEKELERKRRNLARSRKLPRNEAENCKKWRRENPHKARAHAVVRNAVRYGRIKAMSQCEKCGASGKLHKHHADYSKPLEVQWLCVPCHSRTHRKFPGNGAGLNETKQTQLKGK